MAKADSPKGIAMAERRERVLDLARTGLTYRQIADEMTREGAVIISKDTVQRDLQKALELFVRPGAERIKNLYILRSETLFREAYAGLLRCRGSGDETGAQRWHAACLAAMERGAKLEGVDAPRKLEITEITDDMLGREIARLEAEMAAAELRGELEPPDDDDDALDAELVGDDDG